MAAVTSNDIELLKAQMDEMRRNYDAEIERLRKVAAEKPTQTPGDAALQLLAERTAPKENPNYNERGAFTHREGERHKPKARLTRPTFFGGGRQREDELTPAEIEAFNAITQTRIARNGLWKAEVRQNGSAQELHIDVPIKTADDRMTLPGLYAILTELQHGEKAADPASLIQRVAELEAKLAAVG